MLELSYPKRIGDYVVTKSLGSGSTGSVKLARHAVTGHRVALKIIKDSLMMTNMSLFKKSRREIAVLKLLSSLSQSLPTPDGRPVPSHLGVMQLLDVITVPDAVVLVLEYCSGGELFDVLVEHGHLPLDLVLDYLQQLAYALRFCHARGVCHRDLKPENVLLTDDARIKLVDFGLAIMHTPGTLLQTSCGSPQYCAPEVLANEPYDGRAADVWSLGVTLYAMTTGGLPFDDDNMQRLVTKIRAADFFIPPEVPDQLAELLRAMLTPDPHVRISLDGVIASPWFNLHPPRPDVYVELPQQYSLQQQLCAAPSACVQEPEGSVVRDLVNLGMGDGMTIKLRLRAETPCREHEFYHALAAFRPVGAPSAVPVHAIPPPLPATSPAVAHASAMLLQASGVLQPEIAYEEAVSAVVGRPPPAGRVADALAATGTAEDVPVAGSRLLQSVRTFLPSWIGALPHEQAAPLATSVGSDGPLSTHVSSEVA